MVDPSVPSSSPDVGGSEGVSHRRVALVVGALVVITALHYLTPRDPSFHNLHDIWRRLYYAPIVLGALFFGLRGGMAAALLATLLYLPHVLFQWGGAHHAASNQYIEIVMFNVIGLVTGLFSNEQRRRREETQRAYRRLAASFERTKEAERLAAMGSLSAALAHEIRNPLASLKGSLPILTRGIPADDERHAFAEISRRELDRLEELTQHILDYARPAKAALAVDSLNEVARKVATLVGKQAEAQGVEVTLELAEDLPLALIDTNRTTQVLLNLALNGIQAMEEGGTLTLASGFDDEEVFVTVMDTGSGLTAEARDRMFEPFFTTKPEGTGLGLAVAHQWVHKQGGRIDVLDVSPSGTIFMVTLPRRLE